MIYHNFQRRKILVRSLYTAFNSQETFSTLWIIRGMSIVKVFFLERVFEEGIYYVCRVDVFVVTLNVRLHDVTKRGFLSCSIHTEWFLGYTHMMSY